MIKKIKFITDNNEVFLSVDRPCSAKKTIPSWYKKSFSFKNSNKPSYSLEGAENTIKHCLPVFDSITSGYIQKTWTDIYVSKKNDNLEIICSGYPEIISQRSEWAKQLLPTPAGCHDLMLAWTRPWGIKLPRGYSALVTHPMYHIDLPFISLHGIIDADKYNADGYRSVPFFIKKDFEGLIPAGTPMYQIIPFKRDRWISSVKLDKKQILIQRNKIFSMFTGSYKKFFWSKKEYL